MTFKELKLGQHLWVLHNTGMLMMVAKFDEKGYDVCGPWECGVSEEECKIIELIDKPEKYKTTEMYYS